MATGRADELIERLSLQVHPEGGHYSEVFRSKRRVDPGSGRPLRLALTAIYFLLKRGEFSCFHRVRSDETWHHHEGDPLEVIVIDSGLTAARRYVLGRQTQDVVPLLAIEADSWQAARPLGDYALVSCCVGPGFDFDDFSMMKDSPDLARKVGDQWPQWAALTGASPRASGA